MLYSYPLFFPNNPTRLTLLLSLTQIRKLRPREVRKSPMVTQQIRKEQTHGTDLGLWLQSPAPPSTLPLAAPDVPTHVPLLSFFPPHWPHDLQSSGSYLGSPQLQPRVHGPLCYWAFQPDLNPRTFHPVYLAHNSLHSSSKTLETSSLCHILKRTNRFDPIFLETEAPKDEVSSTTGQATYFMVILQFDSRSCLVFPITLWHRVDLW